MRAARFKPRLVARKTVVQVLRVTSLRRSLSPSSRSSSCRSARMDAGFSSSTEGTLVRSTSYLRTGSQSGNASADVTYGIQLLA